MHHIPCCSLPLGHATHLSVVYGSNGVCAATPTPFGVRRCGHSSGVRSPACCRGHAQPPRLLSPDIRLYVRVAIADHLLPLHNGCLDFRASVVTGGLLPSHAALLGDALEVTISLGRCSFSRSAQHRRAARRHNHCRFRVTVGNASVNTILVIGAISGDRAQRAGELIEQGANLSRVVDLFAGQHHSDNLTGIGIHTKVQLPPRPIPPGAMLLDQPLARTAQLQAGAVHCCQRQRCWAAAVARPASQSDG